MTRIEIGLQGEDIVSLTASGHALFAPSGKDLVCAAVSSILTGALNALDEEYREQTELVLNPKTNRISIQVLCSDSSLQSCLRFLHNQLKTVQERYPKHIRIDRKEV